MHAPAWRSGTAPLRPSEGKPLGAPQKGFHRPLFTRGGDGSGLSDLNMELKQGGSVQFTVASSPIASPDGRTRMTTSPLRSGERVGGRRFEFPTPEPLPIVTNSSSGTAPTVVNMSWSAVSGEGTQVGLPQPKQSPEDAKWRGNRPSASPVGTPGHTNGGLPELPVRGGQSPIFPLPGGSPLSPQAILTLQQYCVGSPEEGWEGDGCGRPASNRDVVGKAGRSQLGASFAARPPGSALQRKSMDTSSTEPIVTSHRGIVAPHRKQKQVIASHQLRSGGNTDTPDMAALSITGFNPIHHQNSGSTEGGSVQERPPARQKGAFPQDLQGNLTSHQRQPITVLAPNPSKDNTGSGALTDVSVAAMNCLRDDCDELFCFVLCCWCVVLQRSPRDVKKLTKSLSAGARPPTRAKPLSEALYLDDVDGENPSSRQPKISDIRVTGQSEDAGNVKVTLTGTGKPLLPPQLQFTGRVDGDNDIGISPIKRMGVWRAVDCV